VLPCDEFVIIQRPWDTVVFGGDASADASIQYAITVTVSDTAVVANVAAVVGELTEDKSWIRTRLTVGSPVRDLSILG
jgi:hypothetical protein